MTRAKFECVSVTKREGWGDAKLLYEATFAVVTGKGSPENEKFFASTPSGEIKVGVVRDDHFEVGKSYYVDFTEAE